MKTIWLIVLTGLAVTAWHSSHAGDDTGSQDDVLIVRRGWHIDVGLAARDLQPPLDSVLAELPQARYVLFGFGDLRYVTSKKHHAGSLLIALWPGPGAVLLTGLKTEPEEAFGEQSVIRWALTPRQLTRFQDFLWRSFATTNRHLGPFIAGPYEGSVFFNSSQQYSGLHTCNSWAAEALRAADVPISPRNPIFARPLWREIQRLVQMSPQLQGGRDPS